LLRLVQSRRNRKGIPVAVGESDGPKGDGGVPPHVVRRRFRDPRLRRKDLSAKGLHVPPGDKLPASAVHYVLLLAALLVVRVGVVAAVNALQLPSGGLVPQLLLPGSGLTVGGFLIARPLTRWG